MEFNKLRLLGFKSFVEPTEFAIERGLTGVVGPNGCGKSNLVEALRWVMGENSYKNMRASSMDDVIFSGSANRPSRNMAEVALFLDNGTRTAPAAFNDADELQVSRRIEREAGSVYRINGRDVRAKDVQLLFADVSTGARSPSMIGQGRIGELIAAKPQARRALLEEAAGISGLHSRRHEAELRLRAAETNLERVEDVVAQLDSQLDSLKRQARQASRYRNIAGDIRKAEATILYIRWTAAKQALADAEGELTEATVKVGECQIVQTEAARMQAIIAAKLPSLRDEEAKAAAVLQHVTITSQRLEDEARSAVARREELGTRRKQLEDDLVRERTMVEENGELLAHLDREEAELSKQDDDREGREKALFAGLEEATATLAESEQKLATLTQELALSQAQVSQNERTLRDGAERRQKLENQISEVESDLAAIGKRIGDESDVKDCARIVTDLENEVADLETRLITAEQEAEQAREGEAESREPVQQAQAEVNRIDTESRTLVRILNTGLQDLFAPVLESVRAENGFEKALGAALGDDLDAPLDTAAPIHWRLTRGEDDPALPEPAVALSRHVKAPPELARRLAQTGVVSREDGERLCESLLPGQRLVTRDGQLWRWDGYSASAEAPTAAVLRLEQQNRLAELDVEAAAANRHMQDMEAKFAEAGAASRQARDAEQAARQVLRERQNALQEARKAHSAAERSVSELSNRSSALEEARSHLRASLEEIVTVLGEAEAAQSALPDLAALENRVQVSRNETTQRRAAMAETRAEFDSIARENRMRQDRLHAIERERNAWTERAANAEKQMEALGARLEEIKTQQSEAARLPDEIEQRRKTVLTQMSNSEDKRREAADALASVENDLRDADKVAATALTGLSDIKQTSARAEERVSAATERRFEIEARIREDLQCEAHEALSNVGLKDSDNLGELDAVERKLERLKAERERLGAVNLRAEAEQNEVLEQRETLTSERDDLVEAIRQLRQGIQSLNKEGRERLLTAFDEVNAQFQKLFVHLFGGGTAELQLVESDDPLEAGLEILARPPGKKPQTMTLLSGGEQALTALALIFAVFLTNPAPICVLDEVDAPLDDSNVERFCNLMDQMTEETDTRFVIVTHNPITMARMNRLFGVTMAERGVSQLVSVDLQTAESFQEAG